MNKSFKVECPSCSKIVNSIDGKCDNCGFNIESFMKENGLIYENGELITDKVVICPNCGKIDASSNTLYLNCSECGHSFIATDIPKSNPEKLIYCKNERELIDEYVGDTINWDIYNAREDRWNKIQEERHKYQQQKEAEKKARQDAINNPKCPRCGSTAIDSANRGYSLLSGFLGSGKTMNYCKNCGYKWKPSK